MNLEEIFTISEYNKFVEAIKNRQEYEFLYSKPGTYLPHPKTRIQIKIDGHKCDNGIWADNYLYGYSIADARNGDSGRGTAYCPVKDGIITYEKLLSEINRFFGFEKQKEKQLNFLEVLV